MKQAIIDLIKEHTAVQTIWVTAKDIDWQAKTMTAVDIDAELELFDVLLGLGDNVVKPIKGTKCLLGVIDNKDTQAFLIYAEQVELLFLNGDENGGLLVSEKVTEEINEIKADLNKLKAVFSSWVTVPNDGGAVLKIISSSWASSSLQPVIKTDLENKIVKHGG